MKEEIARILKDEGYIKDFRIVERRTTRTMPYRTLVVELEVRARPPPCHHRSQARLEARPPRLRAQGPPPARARRPRHRIMSTSTGVITNRQAAERGVGGEVIAFVW